METQRIQRGEIYYVCLDPVFGREIGGFKMRPVIVISNNKINSSTRLITVVPGTTTEQGDIHANIVRVEPDKENRLNNPTNFQCHQIRAIEMGRFTQRAKGKVSRETIKKIEKAIGDTLGISNI